MQAIWTFLSGYFNRTSIGNEPSSEGLSQCFSQALNRVYPGLNLPSILFELLRVLLKPLQKLLLVLVLCAKLIQRLYGLLRHFSALQRVRNACELGPHFVDRRPCLFLEVSEDPLLLEEVPLLPALRLFAYERDRARIWYP